MKNIISIFIVLVLVMLSTQVQAQGCDAEDPNDTIAPPKIKLFGFHFATLDIRQDSRVHHSAFTELVNELQAEGDTTFPENYSSMSPDEQVEFLSTVKGKIKDTGYKNEI